MSVAIIGLGRAGRRHEAAFRAAGCEVVGVDRGGDWKAAVQDRDVTAVVVATPDSLHGEMAAFALAKGKHVLCEKPLSHARADLDLLWEIRHKVPHTFSCCLPLRHVEPYCDMLSVTAAERRGPLYMVEGLYAWGRWSRWAGWRAEQPSYSIVCGGGIHVLDLMVRATGLSPTDIEALGSGKRATTAIFRMGNAIGRLTVNFGFEGRHRTGLSLWGERGFDSWLHDEASDFGPVVRQFLDDIEAGRPGNGLEAMAANRAALAIEEACR